MMDAPGVVILTKVDEITEEIVNNTFETATNFLQKRYKYIFENSTEATLSNMSIFTWSHKVRYSEVSKKGASSDIAYLPPAQVKTEIVERLKRGKGQ